MKIIEYLSKKIVTVILVSIFFLINFTINAQDATHVKIGVYENPPKIYIDKNGNVSGFHAELIQEIARRNNWEIEYVYGHWNELLDKTASGKIDIMLDVAFSEKRLERFDFNKEDVFINWAAVYSRRGFRPQTLFDLKGTRVAGMAGGVHTEGEMGIVNLCREFRIDIELILVPDYFSAFEMIQNGKADVAVVNRIFGKSYEQDFDINRTSIIFNPVSIKYAFPKNSEFSRLLISEIDSTLIKMKENNMSIYYKLLDKYLAGYIEEKTEIPLWLMFIMGSITVLLIVLSALIRKLRLEIKRRMETENELREAKKGADAANRAKSIFLANMTHEIRTPMNAILGYSELLQRAPEITEEQRNNLEIINTSGEQLLSLINEILDMSRIEAGKVVYNESNFNIVNLLQQTASLLKPEAAKKDINIRVETRENLPLFIKSDEQKVRQILLNLLSNAVKYSNFGTILITAGVFDENENICLVSVSDTGAGINKKHQERIFDVFERGGKKTASINGVGLGLAISKKYAEFLGGNLRLERSSHTGSTFSFCFKFSDGEISEISQIQARMQIISVKPEFLPVKILIVDDKDTNRDILEKLLRPLGFTLNTAKDGIEGVEAFRKWSPDCILMDILMSEMDGTEAVRTIRNDPSGYAVKIIALSASADDKDKQEIVKAGADAFLYKPYREKQLLEKMAELLLIEYEYREILPERKSDVPDTASLSRDCKEKIIQGAKIASRTDIIEILEKESISAGLKKQIAKMADNYQFMQIIELLNSASED